MIFPFINPHVLGFSNCHAWFREGACRNMSTSCIVGWHFSKWSEIAPVLVEIQRWPPKVRPNIAHPEGSLVKNHIWWVKNNELMSSLSINDINRGLMDFGEPLIPEFCHQAPDVSPGFATSSSPCESLPEKTWPKARSNGDRWRSMASLSIDLTVTEPLK